MKKVGRNVNRFVALILAFSLCLCLLVGTSFAIGSAGPYSTPEEICELCPNSGNAASALNIWKVNGYDRGNYYYLLVYYPQDSYYKDLYFISCSSRFIYYNSHFYCEDPGASFYYNGCGTNWLDSSAISYSSGNTPTVINGVSYYRLSDTNPNFPYWPLITSSSSVFWANFLFDDGSGSNPFADHNLDAHNYEPDPRIFMVSKVTLGGLDYIEIDVNDDDIDYLISVGIDYRLPNDSNTYTAYYFYDSGDFLNLTQVEGLDGLFYQWNLNPNKIFGYEFEVVGATYYGSYSYGQKSVDGLSLTFNEGELVSDPPINISNTYYNSTLQAYYVPGTRYNAYTFRSDLNYVWDSDRYFSQPFNFLYCAVPDIPAVNFSPDSPLIDELLKIYDVVIYVVSSNEFDYFYQSGAYQSLVSSWNSNEPLTSLTEFYSLHDPLPFLGFDEDPVGQFQYSWTNSVIISDRFYFKQANYLFGDTDDILTQFSSRFFEEDGFSQNLFTTLNGLYDNQFTFYNSALPTLNRLSYWLADNHVDFSLENITNLLQSVDNSLDKLTGIDSNLDDLVSDSGSLLTGVDTIISWLSDYNLIQNFELTLPSFDFGSVVQVFGGNIDSFGDWVNELVLVLPDLDYSDFDDWFTNSGNLLSGIDADSNFLGHLGDPYDYSDSGVNYLGWD